jgi:hypothetical protein
MNNVDVNVQYAYTPEILGMYSGGTIVPATYAPHPIDVSYKLYASGYTVTDLSGIVIGGINGLNR